MEQLNTFVLRTLDSGVEPILTTYQPIYDLYCDKAVAFVQTATVDSIVYGSLVQDDLSDVLADSGIATQFFCVSLFMHSAQPRLCVPLVAIRIGLPLLAPFRCWIAPTS